MKNLRKNIDLSTKTLTILQLEKTSYGFGTLKPFLEYILDEFASKAAKDNPQYYDKALALQEKLNKKGATAKKVSRKRK